MKIQCKTLFVMLLITVFVTGVLPAGENGVTVEEVVRMHRDGLSTQVILDHVRVNGFDGSFSKTTEKTLREHNLPNVLIDEIRSAAKEAESTKNRQKETVTSNGERGHDEAQQKQSSAANGAIRVGSDIDREVWVRVNRSERQVVFSLRDASSFIGVSGPASFRMPVASGTWAIRIRNSTNKVTFRVPEHSTVNLRVQSAEEKSLTVSWGVEAEGDGPTNEATFSVPSDSTPEQKLVEQYRETGRLDASPDPNSVETYNSLDDQPSYFQYYEGDYTPWLYRYPGASRDSFYGYYFSPGYHYYRPRRRRYHHRSSGFGLHLQGDFEIGDLDGRYHLHFGDHHQEHHSSSSD